MIQWLRPDYILALITSLYACSSLVSGKTYEKFWCTTEEGHHQISCPDEKALLTDVSIRKVFRRNRMCQPDDHSEYLVHCDAFIDGSMCEGNHSCSIDVSSRDYIQCGDKSYLPTYYFVKYTCTQIHTMCTDNSPIRNTLYGYIVSPGYPHPTADNLTCSINIEADSSMFIELTPIEIHLQETLKCRSDYLEILGYDSMSDEINSGRNPTTNWKWFHTWCGSEPSSNHPFPHARYLITSNLVYISLHTVASKKTRFFKIRYKIVPSHVRAQYNSEGIAYNTLEQGPGPRLSASVSSTTLTSTTNFPSPSNRTDFRHLNGTKTKSSFRKEILIAVICGVVVLLLAVAIAIIVLIFIRRRRSSSSIGKKKSSSTTTSSTNPSSKPIGKSSDKAPLLDNTTNAATSAATKRKLVPERTVQIADVTTSRFKPNESPSKNPLDSTKPILTAADSGIYGADLTETQATPTKLTPVEPPKPIESPPPPPSPPVEPTPEPEVELPLLDNTIQSAYPAAFIDATTSENEGTICGSALESRRTSSVVPSDHELLDRKLDELTSNNTHNSMAFNPLQVILKKDANKYYTTEYI